MKYWQYLMKHASFFAFETPKKEENSPLKISLSNWL